MTTIWRNEYHEVYVCVCTHQIYWDFFARGFCLLQLYSIFSIHEAEAVLLTRFPLTQFDSVDFTVKPDECGHSSGDESQQIKSSVNPILWASVLLRMQRITSVRDKDVRPTECISNTCRIRDMKARIENIYKLNRLRVALRIATKNAEK